MKAVADWLGHASPKITLDTYADVMPADEDVARGVLDSVLDPFSGRPRGPSRSRGPGTSADQVFNPVQLLKRKMSVDAMIPAQKA